MVLSILIATFPVHGHVTPLLGVAESLVARGDRVRFLTGARLAGVVEATGAEYLPFLPRPTSTTVRICGSSSRSAPA